jgi:ParB-like chromosome segregation protein Spo0J
MKPHLQIERVPVDSIFENPQNCRIHPEAQLKKLASSFKRFGQQIPLIVGRDNIIIVGNGRYQVIREFLDWKEVEIIRSNLTAEEAKAFGVSDNQLGTLSEWDLTLLGTTLTELKQENPTQDWNALGFDKEELTPLLGDDFFDTEIEETPDSFNEDKPKFGKPLKLTEEQRKIVDLAISTVREQERDLKMSEGRCLELLCSDFLSGVVQ